jgi:hypothetical protein
MNLEIDAQEKNALRNAVIQIMSSDISFEEHRIYKLIIEKLNKLGS